MRKPASLPSAPMTATTISYFRTVPIAAAIFFLAATLSHSQSVGESDAKSLIVSTQLTSPQQAVLLKKTDRILFGTVRQNGNFYVVEIADQSRVSIPIDQVEFVGANAEEVYQHKCRSITRWMTGDHFKLTRWCLQNKLLVHAIDHFTEVQVQSPNHPSVKQLGAELEQKILSDEKFREFAGLPALTKTQTVAASTHGAAGGVSSASAATKGVSTQGVAHPQIVVYFNDRVQPILMNRCSQAACHGGSSNNSFRLIEPRGTAYARVSSENMKQVLALIEPDESDTPKLLSYATKPHGSQRAASIDPSEAALIEQLKNWIRFSKNPVVTAVATQRPLPTMPNPSLNASSKLNPIAPGSTQLRPVPGSSGQVEFPAGTARPAISEIDALEAQLNQILSKEKSVSAAPRDPFDPAEFNRQAEQQSGQPR